jgi:hypothetical protein
VFRKVVISVAAIFLVSAGAGVGQKTHSTFPEGPAVERFAGEFSGCPECHSRTFSCHSDWQRTEVEEIRQSWMASFHVKLMREPFNPCASFFIKEKCFFCHPNFFRRGRPRQPKFKRVSGLDSIFT